MEETVLETAAMGVAKFLASLFAKVISFGTTMGFLYLLSYIVARYLICENNNEEFSKFAEHIRSGCKDMAVSFKNVMPGVAESAKFWSEERIAKINSLRGRR